MSSISFRPHFVGARQGAKPLCELEGRDSISIGLLNPVWDPKSVIFSDASGALLLAKPRT